MITEREIIDVHTHIFPAKIALRAAENTASYYHLGRQGDGTAECLLALSEGLPNTRFVISSAALKPEAVRHGNDFLLSTAKSDTRFIPLCSFHPAMGVALAEEELIYAKENGAKGVKLHPDFQNFATDDPTAVEIYRICARLGLPILFHVGDTKSDLSHPKRLHAVMEKVPELVIIAAHMCGYSVWELAEKYLIGTPVYTDTSEARLGMDAHGLYRLAEKHGTERIMFGSDYPLWGTAFSYPLVDECGFTGSEKQQIFCDTAKKVFGIA